MTISTTTARVQYTADGVGDTFSVPFKFFADADLTVYQTLSGAETLQVLNTDYTVTGAGNPTGSVVFTSPPIVTTDIIIVRNPAQTQEVDLTSGADMPEQVLEDELDRQVMLVQGLQAALERTIQRSEGYAGTNAALPTPVPTNLLGWDLGGELVNIAPGNLTGVTLLTAFSNGLLAEGTAAAWRTALGVLVANLEGYATDVLMQQESDPYPASVAAPPGDLEVWRQQIHYQLKKILVALGGSPSFWYEDPVSVASAGFRVPILNSSFEAFGNLTAGLPDFWAANGTATMTHVASSAAIDQDVGRGRHVKVVAGAANAGIKYTVESPFPSTVYTVSVQAWATSGDTAKLIVDDGTTTLNSTTTSTTPVALSIEFTSDASGTDIDIELVGVANTDEAFFDHVRVTRASSGGAAESADVVLALDAGVVGTSRTTGYGTGATIGATTNFGTHIWDYGSTDFDLEVTVPSDGYYIDVDALCVGAWTFTNNNEVATAVITEVVDGGAETARAVAGQLADTSGTEELQLPLRYTRTTVTPGSTYRYRVRWGVSGSGAAEPQGVMIGSVRPSSHFRVALKRVTG